MTDQNNRSSESGGPQSGGPEPGGPESGGPQSGGPQSGGPQSGGPQPGGPQSGGPQPSVGRPGTAWQVQDAKARFSELLDASLSEGPQIITRRGAEIAAVVPIEQWRRMESAAPSLKDWLLEPGARAEALTPPRKKLHRRPVRRFE